MNGRKDIAGIVGSIFFAVVGIYVFTASLGMSPMAAMFPRTVGAALAMLAVLQIVVALKGGSGVSVEKGADIHEHAEGLGRRLTLLATMIAWALLFPIMGIFVTSLAACVVLMFTGFFGRASPYRLALYLAAVLAMVVCFYLLMGNVLNIPLPHGLLF